MSQPPKIKALLEQIHSGKLTTDKARILDFVKKKPGVNKLLICGYFQLPHQTVTARLSDLEDMGLIESKGNGKYSNFFFIPEPNAQRIHRSERAARKIEAWAKKGLGLDVSIEFKKELETLITPKDVKTRA